MSAPAPRSPFLSGSGLSGSGQKDIDAVWSVVTALYAAHGAGDVEHVDAQLDPEATMWHSEAETLLRGREDLDRLRAERTATGPGAEVAAYDAYDPVIDVSGHMALVRYRLRVDYAPAPDGTALRPELVRNTAVLRRSAAVWRIVHLHEEIRVAGGVPGTAS
ncbi:nuclear transport factor 2 family protein [Streptomyces chattanoogensis]|uniref:nuclear transport factor 2 family protein n=1 Tax=Streptomyces chattanoogensis TaxID=66876 RepID=UPI00369B7754